MSERCRALDANGHRCFRQDTIECSYHGDGEIYGYDGPRPKWVIVSLCAEHRGTDKRHTAGKKKGSTFRNTERLAKNFDEQCTSRKRDLALLYRCEKVKGHTGPHKNTVLKREWTRFQP